MIRRREFIAGVSAAAWPLVTQAQRSEIPVIGFLARGPNGPNRWGASFRQGLKDAGYVEGQSVVIEYRGYRGGPPISDGMYELAMELASRQVKVILTSSDGAAVGAKRSMSAAGSRF